MPVQRIFNRFLRRWRLWQGEPQAHWYLGEHEPMHGLERWQLDLSAAAFKGKNLSLDLRLVGSEQALYAAQIAVDQNGKAQRTYAAHMQFLPHGPSTLRATWSDAKGVVLGWQDLQLRNHNPPGLGQRTAQALQRVGVQFLGELPCDSSQYPYEQAQPQPWFDEPDALALLSNRIEQGLIQERLREPFTRFVNDGFIVLEGLIDGDMIDAVNAELDQAIQSQHEGYQYGSSQRIENLHRKPGAIRELFLSRAYLDVLDQLYGEPARPCQTLGYVFGSQQDAHQDTIHLTPFPSGYMSGVWFALQDVSPDSGELVVYPGSHRFPRARMHALGCAKVTNDWTEFGQKAVPHWAKLIEQSAISPQIYRPKRGTVLIWHENLMHGGSVRTNTALERRSMVIHAFAQGAVVFYDSSGNVGATEQAH